MNPIQTGNIRSKTNSCLIPFTTNSLLQYIDGKKENNNLYFLELLLGRLGFVVEYHALTKRLLRPLAPPSPFGGVYLIDDGNQRVGDLVNSANRSDLADEGHDLLGFALGD